MKFFDLKIEGWNVILTVNILIIVVLLFIILIFLLFKYSRLKPPYKFKELSITFGSATITFVNDHSDREIAFKSWVEISTRTIGFPIDNENDVIVEIYNSWYKFFEIIRNNIKDISGDRINHSKSLINSLTSLLNNSLRKHLTKWQAKFRKWYNYAINLEENIELSPQEIQRKYPEYKSLMDDLLETNLKMIDLKVVLYKIAFNED